GNPPVMMYLLSGRDQAATNRANFTGYFAITLLMLIALMAFKEQITWGNVQMSALLLPVFMLAAWTGSRLFRKSSEALYRRVALGILFFTGLYGVIR
ncbi:MAG: TSUP family transporter, partial [Rhodospirillales bacterium]|nr:TSUP family transporter [Rhodospirillales bacterium]